MRNVDTLMGIGSLLYKAFSEGLNTLHVGELHAGDI